MLKYKKLSLIASILVLLGIQAVWAFGITEPLPVGLKLLKGDSQRFYFQIQAVTSPDKLECTYSINGLDPLIINLDKTSVTIDAGKIENVYGTITVPETAPVKPYTGQVTVNCVPSVEAQEGTGSRLQQSMVVQFNLNVVSSLEERETAGITEEQPETSNIPTFTILIVIILVVVIGYWFFTKNRKKETNKT